MYLKNQLHRRNNKFMNYVYILECSEMYDFKSDVLKREHEIKS
jgi:hypothetical protein